MRINVRLVFNRAKKPIQFIAIIKTELALINNSRPITNVIIPKIPADNIKIVESERKKLKTDIIRR